MEITSSCSCCLLRPPERKWKLPYTYFGETEIYANMLKDCFEIDPNLSNEDCGICEVCVCRLRDACDFKRQVQRSQAQLLAYLHVKAEEDTVKAYISDGDIGEECQENLINTMHYPKEVKSEISDDPISSDEGGEFGKLLVVTHEYTCNEAAEVYKEEPLSTELPLSIESSNSASKEHFEPSPQCPPDEEQKTNVTSERLNQYTRKTTGYTKKQVNIAYICDVCGNLFAGAIGLSSHKSQKRKCNVDHHGRIRTGDKSWTCEICNERFTKNNDYVEHIRLHSGEKVFTCDVCQIQFRNKLHLIWHMRRQDYVNCKFCTRTIANKELKKHIKTEHNSAGRQSYYICDECKRVFRLKHCLVVHMNVHYKNKMYPCEICSLKLSSAGSLRRHKRIHTYEKPYPCGICNKRFRNKDALNLHILVHTGEKLHCCELCGKRYARRDNLRTHLKTHAEGIRYPCELCSKSYPTKEGLRQHRRTHSKTILSNPIKKRKNKRI